MPVDWGVHESWRSQYDTEKIVGQGCQLSPLLPALILKGHCLASGCGLLSQSCGAIFALSDWVFQAVSGISFHG